MKVALGVTGCIAAYKSIEVMRGLQKLGVEVQVVMTANASRFVGPLTFQSISAQPVITGMFDPTDDPEIKHIQIAQSVDLLLVAPATANALAKFANGIGDDFLSTLYISTRSPVLIAPAMNAEMWMHPATRRNVQTLKERGVQFVDPDEGYLACKTVGPGRLAEPEAIVARAWGMLGSGTGTSPRESADLEGERILVTAGPTYEAIDPVRGITNRSSGKMGYGLATAALDRGANVTLISGPVHIDPPAGARVINVRSAEEMYEAAMENVAGASVVIMAAAVADYRPSGDAAQKIKKKQQSLTLSLEPTEDILAAVVLARSAGNLGDSQIVIGFAAETENVIANAREKLERKGADMIVANDVSRSDSGFEVDDNRIIIVSPDGVEELPLMGKREAADRILDSIVGLRARTFAR